MDSCTESVSTIWLALIRLFGLSRLDEKRDTCARAGDTLDASMREVKARQQSLEKTLLSSVALARKAMNTGQHAQAAPHLLKARRAKKYLAQIRGMLASLQAQQEAIETTEFNANMLELIKESTSAFAYWQKQCPIQDADQVDAIKQDFEDQVRLAQEISDAVATPMVGVDGDEQTSNLDLERELDDLEDYSFGAFVSPRTSMEDVDLGRKAGNRMSPVMEEESVEPEPEPVVLKHSRKAARKITEQEPHELSAELAFG